MKFLGRITDYLSVGEQLNKAALLVSELTLKLDCNPES
jgi:hypothetical protein